jgi:peptide-methionine (S)-S-oxide reductase
LSETVEATFAAGCFWGVEDVFLRAPGVVSTVVGYTGGDEEVKNPSYELVSSGRTSHAEAVRVVFDPEVIGFEGLLEIFWEIHDPTSLNRQGPDVGSQYRSAIFYHSDAQRDAALASRDALQKKTEKPIVTEIVRAGPFYHAEEYHQQYYKKHPDLAAGCPIKIPDSLK